MRKYIFSIFCLLGFLSVQAGPNFSFLTDPLVALNAPPPPTNCNLPAPLNLQTTGIGTTSLSFEWGSVAGSDGFDVELTIVSSGQTVFSGHVNTLAITINNLASATLYNVKVWSICPNAPLPAPQLPTTERRSLQFASKNEATDYVVVDDITINFPGVTGDAIPPFPYVYPQIQCEELYAVKYTSPAVSDFRIFKVNCQGVISDIDHIHVEHNNINVLGEQHWLFGGAPDKIPDNGQHFQATSVFIYKGSIKNPGPALVKIMLSKDFFSQQVNVSWTLESNTTGYSICHVIAQNQHSFQVITDQGDIVTLKTNRDQSIQIPFKADLASERSVSDATDQVQVSPNPFTDELVIQRNPEQRIAATVRLFDLNGREIIQQVFDNEANSLSIPTADLPTGMYLVRYESPDAVKTFKVFKSN